MYILAFLALIPRFFLGFLIIDLIWKSRQSTDLIVKVFLALPAGVGVSSLFSFIWIWAKFDLRIYALGETILILVITVWFAWKNMHILRSFSGGIRNRLNTQSLIWNTLLVISAVLFISFFWINSVKNPHGRWDAWSNWNVVARFVFRGGENWQSTFLRIYDHPDYPFLLAMSNAVSWELLPKETTRGPVILAFIFTLSMAGLVFGLTNALRGSRQAAFAAILLMTQPVIAYHGMALYADLPEAFYFLASAGLIPLFLSNNENSIAVIAGLMAGLGAWTKNEGLTFAAVNLIAWMGIGIVLKKKPVIRNFLLGLSFPIFVVILFKLFLAPGNDLFSGNHDLPKLLFDFQRYVTIIKYAGEILWSFGDQPVGIIGILFIYTIFAGRTRNSTQGILPVIFVVSAQLMLYFVVFVVTPHDLEWHLRTSVSRLYLHLFPLALFSLLLWAKTPDELFIDSKP